jgi:hypothetical protein
MTRKTSHDHLGILFAYFPLIKLATFILLGYYFSYIGIISYLIIRLSYTIVMDIFFNYVPLEIGDSTFVYSYPEEVYTCCLMLKFQTLNREKFIFNLKEKGIKQIERLRYIRTTKNLEFWWKRLTYEEAEKRLKVENRLNIIDNYADIDLEIQNEINIPFKVEEELPYKIIFYSNPNNKYGQVAIFKFDHAFSDGLGIVSLLLSLADNYSLSLFPFNRKYPLYLKLWNFIFLPFYLIKLCILQFSLIDSPSVLKSGNQIKSKISKFSTIHSESFDEITKVTKNYNIKKI